MHTIDSIRPVPATPISMQERSRSVKRRAISPREIERLVDEARNLVPMFARRYLGRGVAFEDLVGAGNLGVVEAAYRFDASRGVKFGSYAAWWIRKAINSALGESSSVVVVPRYSFERRRQVISAITAGRPEGSRDRGQEEVAASLGLSARQVEQALSFAIGVVSLDAPLARDDRRSVGDRLARPAEEGPEAIILDADRARAARAALRVLTGRQRRIIALRFGLDTEGAEPRSLTDVARLMGLSRERVRQIEGEALDAVRHAIVQDARRSARG